MPAANAFVLDIQGKIARLAEIGATGAPREEFGVAVRSFPYKNRIIYFRITGDMLMVLRVLHGHQSNDNLDFD